MRRKADLPEKICAQCGRPFAWRKKWARDWDAVRYCSDRCRAESRRERGAEACPAAHGEPDGARRLRSRDA
ncbi:hypothetical protein GCM10007886_17520 [Methylobacterium gregans]|nr:hypothetical protein GCM10007886_17520 [Methylobacterium gregans]